MEILIVLLLILMLLPSTNITIANKWFKYNYSSDRLYRRHRQFFNYISFHYKDLTEQSLHRFYNGKYITLKQYNKLCKARKFWNYENQ